MGRLEDAGIHSLIWQEDDDGLVHAEGLQDYEIDDKNELAIFQGEKCVDVHYCENLAHAIAIAHASENVCRFNIAQGSTFAGHKINEKGWRV